MEQVVIPTNNTPPDSRLTNPRSGTRRLAALDLLGIAVIAALLRLPAFFSSAAIGFDDGVYGLSANSMRYGYAPFRSVFSSQGPLFLPILRIADFVGFERINSPRVAALCAGVAISIATYLCAIRLTSRGAALLASGLVASSGVVLYTTGPITSDGVAGALAVSTVAAALRFRSNPSSRLVLVISLLAGAAFSTKSLLVIPAIAAAWLLVASTKQWIRAALVPAIALCVLIASALPWGLINVYEQSIAYHTTQPGSIDVLANLNKIATTIFHRDPPLLLLSLLCILFALVNAVLTSLRNRGAGDLAPQQSSTTSILERVTSGDRFLWIWLGAALALLLAEQRLWNNHIAIMAPPAALLVACHLPPWRAVVIALVLAIPLQVSGMTQIYNPKPPSGDDALAIRAISSVGNSWALSDTPGLIWRAGASTDPWFVDNSELRITTSNKTLQITSELLLEAAAQERVCMLVITSEKRWGSFPNLPLGLSKMGYRKTASFKTRAQTGTQTGTLGIYERRCRLK